MTITCEYYWGDKINEDVTGEACATYEGDN